MRIASFTLRAAPNVIRAAALAAIWSIGAAMAAPPAKVLTVSPDPAAR